MHLILHITIKAQGIKGYMKLLVVYQGGVKKRKAEMGGNGRRVFRNMYKGHRDKTKGVGISGGRWWRLGGGGGVGRKWKQLYLNNNKINK